jgi:solute carrier family 25 ornithine transporter 2/15
MAYGQCQSFICLFRNKTNTEQLTTLENMAAGSFASVFSSIALCPTELVKCRIQTSKELSMINASNIKNPTRKKM